MPSISVFFGIIIRMFYNDDEPAHFHAEHQGLQWKSLWETLSEEDIPVTPEERALLDARLADLEANPGDQSLWSEVRARLEQRRR